jgi:hypothetical protein
MRWNKAWLKTPTTTEAVLAALPTGDVVSAQYVEKTKQWFYTNTNDEVWPTLWGYMPKHPHEV